MCRGAPALGIGCPFSRRSFPSPHRDRFMPKKNLGGVGGQSPPSANNAAAAGRRPLPWNLPAGPLPGSRPRGLACATLGTGFDDAFPSRFLGSELDLPIPANPSCRLSKSGHLRIVQTGHLRIGATPVRVPGRVRVGNSPRFPCGAAGAVRLTQVLLECSAPCRIRSLPFRTAGELETVSCHQRTAAGACGRMLGPMPEVVQRDPVGGRCIPAHGSSGQQGR